MTIWYPDISGFQAGVSLRGTVAVCCKATEGTGYVNPDYARARGNAAANGAWFFAYHFLHAGQAAAQAAHAHATVGRTPLMLDVEPTTGSNPSLADAVAFVDAYRKLGGVIGLVYLPRWYWSGGLRLLRQAASQGIIGRRSELANPRPEDIIAMGSPSLAPLASRGMHLVSSSYTAYSDTGPGWQPYGGLTPAVWQYTSSFAFNGYRVDFNAFKGTVDQLQAAAAGTVAPAPRPTGGKDMTPATICYDGKWWEFGVGTDNLLNVKGPGATKWVLVKDHRNGNTAKYISGVSANVDPATGEVHVIGEGTDHAVWVSKQLPGGAWEIESAGGKLA